MEIYLDANATTPVLPEARAAALVAMADDFGNPSSVHGTGLKARALVDQVRARARRVLGVETGELLFLSGATEGIQTAVLSALRSLRKQRSRGDHSPSLLLYGATEHKAVPEAIKHWNELLGLHMQILAIPVGRSGRHDLNWLRERAPRAALVCTMAANNETGVISDLDGIANALRASPALWMVDSVQALGKLPLRLSERPIDYAPFSGHKLYGPKGIGLLYVREGAPITPLLAGGGQEGALRSGTENTPGIAALGAVLAAIEEGRLIKSPAVLESYRQRLTNALLTAFPGLVFNAPQDVCIPTTLNFSVPKLSSKLLLDLFDAAEVRVSGGSACSAARAEPSFVLAAMGVPAWQAESAVRMSFGPATDAAQIEEACRRILACGSSAREDCLTVAPEGSHLLADRITRFVVDGACCYVVADAITRRCVVIDPLPALTSRIVQWIRCRRYALEAVLDTHSHGDHASSAANLRDAVAGSVRGSEVDALGWPAEADAVLLGALSITRLAVPGHTCDSTAYLLHDGAELCTAFVGDTVMPGSLGRSDIAQSQPLAYASSLRWLRNVVGDNTLLLPGHDYDDRFACTLASECHFQPILADLFNGEVDDAGFARAKARLERSIEPTKYRTMACGARVDSCAVNATVELDPAAVEVTLRSQPSTVVVDVREPYEQRLGGTARLSSTAVKQAVALSALVNTLPRWLALPQDTPVLFLCRSGNRSAQAARALRRLGHAQAWSVAGGLALWPRNRNSV